MERPMRRLGKVLLATVSGLVVLIYTNSTMGFIKGFPIAVHESITTKALLGFQMELGNGTTSVFQYQSISRLAEFNAKADDDQTIDHHFDNDTFAKSSARIVQMRGYARDVLLNESFLMGTNVGKKRRTIQVGRAHEFMGEALHTLQDFFSHTNWIEIQGELAPDVVQRNRELLHQQLFTGKIRGASRNNFCDVQDPQYSVLTSGWVFDPDSLTSKGKYALETCQRPSNKCPHGPLLFICPDTAPPTLGLNKDQPCDVFITGVDCFALISLHNRAKGEATLVTEYFMRRFLADVLDTSVDSIESRLLEQNVGKLAAKEARRVAVCAFMGDPDPLACADPLPLVVKKDGAGKGSVSSQRGQICGPNCSEDKGFFMPGEVAKLTALQEPGSVFVEWSGDTTCTTDPKCDVPIDKERTVMAKFAKNWTLQVFKINAATTEVTEGGYVYSSLSTGIKCGITCSYEFPNEAQINLWAEDRVGFKFKRWANDSEVCPGSESSLCPIVSLDSDKIAKALFTETPKTYFTDPRDNKVYETIVIDGKEWFFEDLRYQPNSSRNNYHFSQIADVTPVGWRTPTVDDFLSLMSYLGMTVTEPEGNIWEPGSALMENLNVKIGPAEDFSGGPWWSRSTSTVGHLMTSTGSGNPSYPFKFLRFNGTSVTVYSGGMSDAVSMTIRPVRSAQ